MSQAPRVIATVRAQQGYDGLHRGLRARAEELQIRRNDIDELAGIARGHASKILAPYPIKALGRTTLGPMLYALKCMILLVPDDSIEWDDDPGVKNQSQTRGHKPLMRGTANLPGFKAIRRKVLTETLRKNGKKGGLKSGKVRKSLPPEERRQIALRGARTRRRRERERRRMERCAPGGSVGMKRSKGRRLSPEERRAIEDKMRADGKL